MLRLYQKPTHRDDFQQVGTLARELWVHADNPTPDELARLVDYYKLDPNIVRDINDGNELPRSEWSGDGLYVFLRAAVHSRHGQAITSPLLAVVAPSGFITITISGALMPSDIIAASGRRALRTSDGAAMLLAVMEAITAQYQDLVGHTGNYIQDIRHKLQNHEVGNRDFIHFVTIEDNLNEYQFCLQDMLVVTERLGENAHKVFKARELEELDDTKLYMKQLVSAVASHTQTINSIRNAYSTIANNTLNQRMKTLTVFTVLIALPNVFYGMYGMNIALPFQDAPWAYAVIVFFTVLLIFAVYSIAKRYRLF